MTKSNNAHINHSTMVLALHFRGFTKFGGWEWPNYTTPTFEHDLVQI